jgi:hypothetical protein
MRNTTLLLAALLMAACTPQNGESPNSSPTPHASGAADTVAMRGTVAVVGSAPMNTAVTLRGTNGQGARIDGPLAAEIGRLSGAEVEVTGSRQADPMHGQVIHASGYTVRSVDGRPVMVGVVEQAQDGQMQLRMEDGRVVRLAGGTGSLRAGQKVWIQGPQSMQVQTFGVIRP